MPKQKDLKRIVRVRMQKTGESYTAARLQVTRKKETPPPRDLAALAGMSDAAVKKQTGRDWAAWVRLLDSSGAAAKPHREIVDQVVSLDVPPWWSQMITVGYERIRGLRVIGQRREGSYEISKSKTFAVPVERLFEAFTNARLRSRWLPEKLTVRKATPHKSVRITWHDATSVEVGFMSKGADRSAVAVQHTKLPDKATADHLKTWWGEKLAALAELLSE